MLKDLNQSSSVYYDYYPAKSEGKATVLIVHGMAEHIGRYASFATFLSQEDYHVYAYDQRGHGKTAGYVEALGYFGKEGWSGVVEDVKDMVDFISQEHELPVYVLGHSMGSFVSREFASRYSDKIQGLILSGTGYKSGIKGYTLMVLAGIEQFLLGAKHPSTLIDRITNKVFNAGIKPLKTHCDWLSLNEENVMNYMEDPYCGTVFSASFYRDLFSAVERVNKRSFIAQMENKLPILLFSGKGDPVGMYGEGVKQVHKMYEDEGHPVDIILYEGRHEMLLENNKEMVYDDVLKWLEYH